MDERRSSIEVKRPRDEKRVETLPGECPIRTAILYKDNKELCHWLSNEQQQHMKRIDVIHRNEIEAVLRGIKDATTPQHIVKQGRLIQSISNDNAAIVTISTKPINIVDLAEEQQLISSVCATILSTVSNPGANDDISTLFDKSCTEDFQHLIIGDKAPPLQTAEMNHLDYPVARRMLRPDELQRMQGMQISKIEEPEMTLAKVQADKQQKNRCQVL